METYSLRLLPFPAQRVTPKRAQAWLVDELPDYLEAAEYVPKEELFLEDFLNDVRELVEICTALVGKGKGVAHFDRESRLYDLGGTRELSLVLSALAGIDPEIDKLPRVARVEQALHEELRARLALIKGDEREAHQQVLAHRDERIRELREELARVAGEADKRCVAAQRAAKRRGLEEPIEIAFAE